MKYKYLIPLIGTSPLNLYLRIKHERTIVFVPNDMIAGRVGALIDCLQRILNCPEKLYNVNSIILNEPMLFDFIIHCNRITAIYKGGLNDRQVSGIYLKKG